ncbi:MAG: ATP-dependent zinc metalloprotease FtsH [Thermodesulfobacteriota bacterium]
MAQQFFKENKQMIIILALLLGVLLWSVLSQQLATTRISYSDFLRQVDAGNVQEITVKGDEVHGSLKQEATSDDQSYQDFLTYIPSFGEEGLMQELQSQGVQVNTEPEANPFFWYIIISMLPLLLIAGLVFAQYKRMQGQGGGIFSIGQSQAKQYDQSQEKTTFNDVAGADEAKVELQEVVDYLKDPMQIQDMGGKLPKGIMLVGPPGTGKTLLARAVAGEAGVPFFSITGSDFMEMFVGVGAKRVRNLFQDAKKNAPCIIFIDEIDAIGRRRGAGLGGGHDEREQTLNQLLSELDGFEANENVVVMTATNRPDILDPALSRPGRFDRRIVVDLPTTKDRLELLQIYTRDKKLEQDVDLERLARETPGFSGADLENMLNEAALLAARDKRQSINRQDIEAARDKILMGLKRHGLALTPEEKRMIAYHEAGHSIVGALLPYADPIHKVSIVPRSQSMGATQQFPEQERYIFHREYLLDRLAVMMGGRCAEDLVFQTATSGAANDLQQATKMARRMVLEWGMSEQFEHMALGSASQEVFLGEELGKTKEYSENTSRIVDQEVESLLKQSFQKAKDILNEHRQALDELSEVLLEQEEIPGEKVYSIAGVESR